MSKVKRGPIYSVSEEGADGRWLSLTNDYDDSRVALTHELTGVAIAEMLDLDAESRNQHAFVGAHIALFRLLESIPIGIGNAEQAMLWLAYAGGLHRIGQR